MALIKEHWEAAVKDQLVPDTSFLSVFTNYDGLSEFGKIHIPIAGSAATIRKNLDQSSATFKGTRTKLVQTSKEFSLDVYSSDIIPIMDVDKTGLSYNKIVEDTKAVWNGFNIAYGKDATRTLVSEATATKRKSTGTVVGGLKQFTFDDVIDAMADFGDKDVPEEGRYMLMSYATYKDLAKADKDLYKDLINGKIYNFNVQLYSGMPFINKNSGALMAEATTASTANASPTVILYHKDDVFRSQGAMKMWSDEDPEIYGSKMSFQSRFKVGTTAADRIEVLYKDKA